MLPIRPLLAAITSLRYRYGTWYIKHYRTHLRDEQTPSYKGLSAVRTEHRYGVVMEKTVH
jgi:hypothetical protein